VRVGWLSTVGGEGNLDGEAVAALGRGDRSSAESVLGSRFARTQTYDRVDCRLIGPELQLYQHGGLNRRSQLLLEAAAVLLVKNDQIA
jgi:hypothetical protein